ncbi:MAG: co-chaperone DjlA [Cellvibrionales bacterium]|nr:co-chaperone DjlA [Cellvibrionales bacterium]
MFIWGRLLGVIIGFAVGRFLGAAVGYMAGWFFDRSVSGVAGDNLRGRNPEQIKAIFMRVLFTALGDVAKADGRISEAEIAHTEQIIKDWGLDASGREKAIAWFKEGADPNVDYRDLLKEFVQVTRGKARLKQVLLETLISLAMVDGELRADEEQKLLKIASGIGLPAFVFQHILNLLKSQQKFQGYSAGGSFGGASPKDQLADAYNVLGVDASVSDKELKKAYRKLMSENHPDKLMAKGVPESAIKGATERSQVIQSAYDLIKKDRKI